MPGKTAVLLSLAGFLACHSALAADPEAGKAKAATCAGCHGPKGISPTGGFPNIAGQKPEYLSAQLTAFRDKTRVSPVMNGMAASLKDEDIANLAAYYGGLKACE